MSFLVLHLGLSAALATASDLSQSTTRVSVSSTGGQGNQRSEAPVFSSDGRFVVFHSLASNLLAGDTNGVIDLFVHDRLMAITSRVSVSSSGAQANGESSYGQDISADGRFVVFQSWASNLVVGDTNGAADIFIHDRQTGITTRVSVDSFGAQSNADSGRPTISDDGRMVAFHSPASNLVPGDTNGQTDAFLHDRQTGTTRRVSVDSSGIQGNSYSTDCRVSGNGSVVAFDSSASNLVAGDTNGTGDVFSHDLLSGVTVRVSLDSAGGQGNDRSFGGQFSDNLRYVVFASEASNLVPGDTNGRTDLFLKDLLTGMTERISAAATGGQANHDSYAPAFGGGISEDGRFVVFRSFASNLVSGDTNGWDDIFLRDRVLGLTTRESVDSLGSQGDMYSTQPVITPDGRFIAFESWSTNLVPGDTNGWADIFVRDRGPQPPVLLRTGTCPGLVTLAVADATPSSLVVLLYGPAGVFTKPSGACAGLTLAISPPTMGATRTTDAGGGTALTFPAPPGACGLTIQAVDAATCTPTNALVL